MKSFLLVSTLVMSLAAFAEEGKDISGYGTMDMRQLKTHAGHSGLIKLTCKTAGGIDLSPSSPDFANCMRQKANKMK